MARQIGLKNIYFAELIKDTKNSCVYSIPKIYERAISATLTPKTNSDTIYSDDTTEDVISTFDSCEVEIEVSQLQIPTRAFLQGAKTAKGMIIENGNDLAPYVAMGFMSKKSNGAYKYVWLTKGQFQIVTDSYETIADKVKAQTSKVKSTFIKRDFDDNWRFQADEDFNTSACATWFDTVPTTFTSNISTTITSANINVLVSATATALTVKTGSKVSNLVQAIQVDGGLGTVDIFTSSNKTLYATNSATITADMVVVATAEDGVTQTTYTITLE
ncbi:major tail protein [Clostridium felsineum]|uniref:Uncharacterized protein n=1 Tax=Clostridium felsineum TaxID=36839 RepID=A0A1S8M2E5_9CLOT|nr:major tail protein [Clostridium felsineum]URZ06768.1 hypothetical protein CLROS_021010 [Clostridium felsineum]URZ11800.1 hypothetical protein CROST_025170 [Clostridium felsineum]